MLEVPDLGLVFDFCDKGDLKAYLRDCKPSFAEIIHIFVGISRGMVHIHSSSIRTMENTTRNRFVHRDLKPENILMQSVPASTEVDRPLVIPKIADFGLARHSKGFSNDERAGTWYYMPP